MQVPGLALKGGLMHAGENGYPTRQGKSLNGVAPRGGFAWSLSSKDVMRGGYGFYWAPMQFSGVGETAMGRLGYTATTTYLASIDGNRTPENSLSNPFPAGITPPQGSSLGLATGAGGVIDYVNQNSQPGQVHRYPWTTRVSCQPVSRSRSATPAAAPSACRLAARWTPL